MVDHIAGRRTPESTEQTLDRYEAACLRDLPREGYLVTVLGEHGERRLARASVFMTPRGVLTFLRTIAIERAPDVIHLGDIPRVECDAKGDWFLARPRAPIHR